MNDRYVGVQWSYDFLNTQYLNKKSKDSYREDLYYSYLFPYSKKYYSVFNPFILIGGAEFSELHDKKNWLIRDGDLILSLFFNQVNPNQLSEDLKILVHIDCAYLVPEKWKAKINYYNVLSKKTFDKNNLPKKIFISGIYETLAFENEFEFALENLKNEFTLEQINQIEIYAYLPDKRSDLWGRWEDVNIYKYSKALFEKLKMDISFPEIDIIMANNNFSDTLYYEINSGLFLKDSFLKHFTFSKGAGELKDNSVSENFQEINRVDLSLNHEIIIYKNSCNVSVSLESNFQSQLQKHYLNSFQGMQLNDSWEVWLKAFIKKSFTKRNGI